MRHLLDADDFQLLVCDLTLGKQAGVQELEAKTSEWLRLPLAMAVCAHHCIEVVKEKLQYHILRFDAS